MSMWGVLLLDAHVLVPTALDGWLAVLDVYASVLLVSFSWLLLSGSPLVFPHTVYCWKHVEARDVPYLMDRICVG